ncbi:hypothetical protein ABTD45_19425, partial [Acinetobacter baumannii]
TTTRLGSIDPTSGLIDPLPTLTNTQTHGSIDPLLGSIDPKLCHHMDLTSPNPKQATNLQNHTNLVLKVKYHQPTPKT